MMKKRWPDKNSKGKWNASIIPILILIILICYLFFSKSDSITMNGTDEGLLVKYGTEQSFVIKYSEISSVTIRNTIDVGQCISGVDKQGIHYGTYKNSEMGLYQAAFTENIPQYIVIKSDSQNYILNFENADSTKSLYEALLGIKNGN